MEHRLSVWNLAYLAVSAAAIPIVVEQITSGLYAPALFTGGAAVLGAGQAVSLLMGRRTISLPAALDLVNQTAAPTAPVLVRVVAARGDCPLGFTVGNAWVVGREGKVEPALCRPALAATSGLVPGVSGQHDAPARCHCPFADAALTFAIDRSPEAA